MEEIKRLIEERQVMAVKKELTKKLLCVVRNLGSPIVNQTSGYGVGLSSNEYDSEAWLTEDERNLSGMPTATDEDYSENGYIYDSLARGHNFEVRYLTYDKELRAKYNGYVVYLEEDGKLKAYLPHEVWEKLTNDLYDVAKPKDEARKAKEKEEANKGFMRQATKFLKELRDSWGI